MKEKGQGHPDHKSRAQKNAQLKEQGGYHKESTANNPSGTLNSIRADQDVETFVGDLRQNKDQLLSLAQQLIRKPADTRVDRGANLAIGIYLDFVLKQHVFGINPFSSKRPGDEELQELREALVHDVATRGASGWLKNHPESGGARMVSKWGVFAGSDSHQRLLQEIWPVILYGTGLTSIKSK